MKHKNLCWQATLPALLLAYSAQAHDPAEHMNEAEKPDCAVMEDMDHSQMDMDDPVVQAMMQKCMEQMHQGESETGDSHADHSGQSERENTESQLSHEH